MTGIWSLFVGLEVGSPGGETHVSTVHTSYRRIRDRVFVGGYVDTPFGTLGGRRDVVCDGVSVALRVAKYPLDMPCRV
jgi:hypothetical protein